MHKQLIAMGIIVLALSGILSALAFAPPGHEPAPAAAAGQDRDNGKENGKESDDEEVVVKLADAPEAVRAAIAKLTPESGVKKVERKTDDDMTTFEAEYSANGADCSVTLTDKGEIIELEKGVQPNALPAAVAKAIAAAYPKGAVKEAASVQVFYYEVQVTVDGKTREVKVMPSGEIEDDEEHGEHHGEHHGEGHGEHHEK